MSRRALGLVLGLAAAAGPLLAQERLIERGRTVIEPVGMLWRFSEPLAQDSLSIDRVWQLSFPVSTSVALGDWILDVGAAASVGGVRLADGRTLDLKGLTDAKLRLVGHLIRDRLLVTAGLNAPIGTTRLAGTELDVLRVLGSPALALRTPYLGLGLGGTAGLVFAGQAGDWGLAIGASIEARGRYAPVESRIAGVARDTDLDPGNAVRLSLGADRLVGGGRLSFLVAADLFGEDRILTAAPGSEPFEANFKLGPQLSVDALLELAPRGFQRVTLSLSDRYRTKFTGIDGAKADGSAGNRLELAAEALTGGAGASGGLYGRVTGRLDGGLEVDPTITTAAATIGTLTLGVWRRAGRALVQPFVQVAGGRIDPGPATATALGFGAGVSVTVR
ncbi:MAG: hypothetical protein R2909_12985 [Gemmatimonadales bacterium]